MRKKLISIFAVFLVICVCICYQFVYADAINNRIAKTSILSSSNLEIEEKSTFDLIIDLDKITFNDFKLELSSNIVFANPILEDAENKDSLQTFTDIKNNSFEIIASKSELGFDKLSLSYTLPDSILVGNSIQFILKCSSTDTSEDIDLTTIEDSITFKVVKLKKTDSSEKNDSITNNENDPNSKIDNSNNTLNDISNNPNNNSNNNLGVSVDKLSNDNSSNQSTLNNMQSFSVSLNNSSNNSNLDIKTTVQSNSSNSASSLNSNSQVVTYDGSSNNYLSTLEVDGYTFNNSFSKTTSTYFVFIPNETTELTINASAEDSTSTICIYGETELNSGYNKILINVTAENGSVRTYRIFAIVK